MHKQKKSIVPGLRVNVSKTERIVMIAAGAYLLYRVLKKNDKRKVAEGIAAGTMLFRGVSGYCPAYDAVDRSGLLKGSNISITTSLSIDKPVAEVYAAWRNLESLPKFLSHIESVTETDANKSEWKAKIPAGLGATMSWTAEILMDEPNKLLSWHSLPGAAIDNAGKVRFTRTGADSTDIEVTLSYHAPLGKPGQVAGKLLTPVFEKMLKKDIAAFKEYIETGNVSEA
ncbi:hypothetical protein AM493_09485 [Flavobacterium akiainvivens]|uniref:Uncharacterized protein n=1 Tax=Flavobacterium akiainvivens TaxID=1202724 RepID=A0A0M8MGC0_9FLAO|nr:hypothetical protein AM493_09485 [Flavobacterium akiainvivens]